MSELNVNLSQFFGPQGAEGAQETQGTQRQTGASQTDTVGQQEQFAETTVPANSNAPVLQGPLQQLLTGIFQQGQQPEDPATQEQNVRHALESDPEVGEAINALLNRRDRNTPEGREELTKQIAQFLQQRGLPTSSGTVQQALANQVQQLIGSASPQDAAELQGLLNNLRTGIFQESNPEFESLVNVFAEEGEAQGLSPEEARIQAQARALEYIDNFADQNEIPTPLLSPNTILGPAIVLALTESFSTTLDPESAAGLATGIVAGNQIFSTFITFLNGINEGLITNDPELSAATVQSNTAPAINAGNNLLTTADEIANGTAELRESLPGNRVELEEFLRVLAETIGLIQEVLRELQIADARRASETSRVEAEFAGQRREARQVSIDKALKALEKQQKNNKIFRIVGIIVAVLAAPLAVLLLPAAALTLPVILVVIAVSVALAATFIALQETGVLAKAFEQLSEALDSAISPAWLAKLVNALIVVVLITIAVAAAAATGGALGSLVGQIGGVLARIVALQVGTALIAQSNVVGTIVDVFFRAAVPDPTPEQEQIASIVKAIISAITILLVAVVGGKAVQSASGKISQSLAEGGKKAGELTARAQQIGTQVVVPTVQGAASVTQAAGNINSAINAIEIGRLRQAEAEANAVAIVIDQLIQELRQQAEGLLNDSEQAAQLASELSQLFHNIVGSYSNIISNLGQANIAG